MATKKFQSTPPARGATRRSFNTDSVRRFQSTPPARGATATVNDMVVKQADFNPRPPRGGRQYPPSVRSWRSLFQSTPPARGATLGDADRQGLQHAFQSTPPARGATLSFPTPAPRKTISIHAPREGGDF